LRVVEAAAKDCGIVDDYRLGVHELLAAIDADGEAGRGEAGGSGFCGVRLVSVHDDLHADAAAVGGGEFVGNGLVG
jgi:hypothetical protein